MIQTLHLFNFSPATIRLIHYCISMVNMSALWNRVKSEFFSTKRCIRQGDPLSTFMFVIYLERLPMIVNKVVREKRWQTFDVCKGGPKIPFLLFADDLLLFTKANEKQATVAMEITKNFCEVSCQCINTE